MMLMANLGKASGTPAEEGRIDEDKMDFGWWALCLCACIGALSLCTWLRDHLSALIKSVGNFMRYLVKATNLMKKVYTSAKMEVRDGETQASQWFECQACAQCTEKIQNLENECFAQETYIDELEAQVERMKETLNDFLIEREVAEKYSSKLERRLLQLKMTHAGRVLHFSAKCPHFAVAQPIRQRNVCLTEGGVTEIHET